MHDLFTCIRKEKGEGEFMPNISNLSKDAEKYLAQIEKKFAKQNKVQIPKNQVYDAEKHLPEVVKANFTQKTMPLEKDLAQFTTKPDKVRVYTKSDGLNKNLSLRTIAEYFSVDPEKTGFIGKINKNNKQIGKIIEVE